MAKKRSYPNTFKDWLEKAPREGVRYILAYDFTKVGAEKVVEKLRSRIPEKVDSVLLDMVEAPEWTLEELLLANRPKRKTRYLIVAVRAEALYEKEVIKHLDFVHRSLGYQNEEETEIHLVKTVKEFLMGIGIVPANNFGVLEVNLDSIGEAYASLPTLRRGAY